LKKILVLFVICIFWNKNSIQSQSFEIDSLLTELNQAKEDTTKVNILNNISYQFYFVGDFDTELKYAEDALNLAKKLKWKKGIAHALKNIGSAYDDKGNYIEALEYYTQSIKLFEEIGSKKGIADTYNNIGSVYVNQGNYVEALKKYFSSLKIMEETNDKKGLALVNNNIGLVYHEQNDFIKALNYYHSSLKIMEEMKDMKGIANAYNNIGNVYLDQYFTIQNVNEMGDSLLNLALNNHQMALNFRQQIGDQYGIATSYNNMGNVYEIQGNFTEALKNHFASLKIKEETGSQFGMIRSYGNIGNIYIALKQYNEGKKWLNKSLDLSKELGIKEAIKLCYGSLYLADSSLNNFESAFENYKMYIFYRDSLINEENIGKIVELEMQYKFDKKLTADSLANIKEKEIQIAEIKRQEVEIKAKKNQQYALVGFLALVLVFAGFMYNRYRITNKQKQIIEIQKNEVEVQKNETELQKQIAEEKNKEILDSIQYAKRLQDAILPPVKLVKEYFDDSFILYHPKDIVSGDFYWMETTNELTMFAAADCTGHGVPGAMVSIVCANALNKVVNELEITDPGKILDYTREIVIEAFSANEASSNDYSIKDGMDISLCVLNDVTGELRWSGANNPLWIIRKDAQLIEEIKPDKQPIAKSGNKKPFKTHSIKLNGGDSIYMFSDGYADQFGGEKGKKFKASQFKTLLLTIKDEPMPKQKELLMATFENWKGKLEQIDDVCIIGVKVTSRDSNPFSTRELEILQLLKDGYISKLIADKLFISIHTVDTHRRRMLKKANVSNTTELINFCEQNNFI
jgi:serine phosphatase RsbU (regulator of sigma subunit)/DNA-binding CsgD family transcriptional regulator